MKKTMLCLMGILFLAGMVMGCATQKVTRVSPDEAIDLSGRWNDTDSRLVAEEMIKEALSRQWVDHFGQKHHKQPTVIVGTVVNRSHEHINVQTFIKDLERELTNSGRVQFVASKAERDEIRDERIDQQIHSSDKTAKALGREIGADYMLKGTISSIQDEEGRTKVVYYQVSLELVDIETNVKAWFGDKKIKKVVEKRRIRF